MSSPLLDVAEELLHSLPLGLTTLVGSEGPLRKLQGLLGVLGSAGLEQLNHTLLVATESTDFVDYLPDELHTSASSALLSALDHSLGLLFSLLDCSGDVSTIETDGNALHLGVVLVDRSLLHSGKSIAHL